MRRLDSFPPKSVDKALMRASKNDLGASVKEVGLEGGKTPKTLESKKKHNYPKKTFLSERALI